MFFSPWEIDAGGYGDNVQAYYLNIKNPAPESLGYKALKMFQGQNDRGVIAREYLVRLGYDGVNNGNEEYIAFEPNQIKLASNTNPTEDVDIRYSSEVYPTDEWAESLSRSKEFAVKFTENIDTNGIYFTEQEYRIIQEALKNGNGKVQAEGVYGTVTSALYAYTFKILSNNDVIVLDYSPREEYDNIENEILDEVYYDGSDENGSYGNEKTRSQRRNVNEYGVPFAETGNGRGSFKENFRESVDEQDGNNGNGRKNGGLRLEDAKVKPWKSYESVAKIKEKIKYGFKLTASEKSILDSKGISYPADNSGVRFSTSIELDKKFPGWNDNSTDFGADSKKGQSTQVSNTVKTYVNVGEWIAENLGKNVSILDASSGMGLGTNALREAGFNVEDVEPYPSGYRMKNNPPTYTKYGDIPGYYDVIISNAVLNVIPDDWRADVLGAMAEHLAPGGWMYINTRDVADVKTIKNKTEVDSPTEVLVGKPGKYTSYQKFFKASELRDWVQSQLGDGYTVYEANKANSGSSAPAAVVVTKSYGDIRFSADLAPVFYSRLEREIDAFKGDKIGAASIVPYLKGKGVKAEEIKWSGIEQFLEGKKSVTKQELKEFLAGTTLQIEEDFQRS